MQSCAMKRSPRETPAESTTSIIGTVYLDSMSTLLLQAYDNSVEYPSMSWAFTTAILQRKVIVEGPHDERSPGLTWRTPSRVDR